MARRTALCGCGAEFPIPEIPPSLLHCPRCGHRMTFGSPDRSAVTVREDIREPLRPLPPPQPWFPLVLLGGAGLAIAASLIAGMIYFTRHPRMLPDVTHEGVRAKRRDPDPILSIREIPVLPTTPQSPSIAVDPSKVAPLLPESPLDVTGPLARAQPLCVRANLCGIVLTVLTLTGNLDDARQVEAELERAHQEIRGLLRPLGNRPEVLGVEYFKPGDQLQGLGAAARDPLHPLLFAAALRGWLGEAQGGAFALATIERDGRTFTHSMWFPDFALDLTRRVLPAPSKSPK
ncbi:MAG TPA: hypothetical protein VKW04_11750 [Planctomycetota bacterium]|nr:hypothetical protein [Planctomycetota bacterium]